MRAGGFRTLIAGAIAAMGIAACGGSGNSGQAMLHLRGEDISEENYRAAIRATLSTVAGIAVICPKIADLSDEGTVNYVKGVQINTTPVVHPGGVANPRPEGEAKDNLRAAQLLKDECNRYKP